MSTKNLQKNSSQSEVIEILKKFRPDIYVLMDLLDNTGINPYIVFHIIKHLNNIQIGSRYGNVVTTLEDGIVTFIRGEESTRLNEALKTVKS